MGFHTVQAVPVFRDLRGGDFYSLTQRLQFSHKSVFFGIELFFSGKVFDVIFGGHDGLNLGKALVGVVKNGFEQDSVVGLNG